MPRRNRTGSRIRANERRDFVLLVSVILWMIGFADVILGAVTFPNNIGVWALALAGLLMILSAVTNWL
jgi:hypothetical protein